MSSSDGLRQGPVAGEGGQIPRFCSALTISSSFRSSFVTFFSFCSTSLNHLTAAIKASRSSLRRSAFAFPASHRSSTFRNWEKRHHGFQMAQLRHTWSRRKTAVEYKSVQREFDAEVIFAKLLAQCRAADRVWYRRRIQQNQLRNLNRG